MMDRPQRATRDIATRTATASAQFSRPRTDTEVDAVPRVVTPSGEYRVVRPSAPCHMMDAAISESREQARLATERDRQLMCDAFEALLCRERQAALSWAREFLNVGGGKFRGTLNDLRRIHAFHPMTRVEQLIQREQEIAASRKRLGAL